jgi:uncharacterized protein (TIGR00162 family)
VIIWNVVKKPRLKNPLVIEGLPGMGNVGKVTADYLADELKATMFAELYSDNYPYHVFVNEDDTVDLPRNVFYYWKAKKKGQRDLIIITGDVQSMNPQGHYEVVNEMLDFVEKFGAKEIITIGGFAISRIPTKPKVIGAVTDDKVKKKYKKFKINFEAGQRVGIIIGASGLLLGLAKVRGMGGLCLIGETIGRSMFTDTRASKAVLEVLKKILNVKIDMTDMEKRARELEKAMVKAEEIEKAVMKKMKKSDEFRYIA